MESTEGPRQPRFTRRHVLAAATIVVTLLLAVGAYALGSSQTGVATERMAGRSSASGVPSLTETASPSTVGTEPVPTTTAPSTTASSTTAPPPPAPAAAPNGPAYVFPLRPATAGRYDPAHHDYPAADIFAECGTEVVAPHAGVVQDVNNRDTWSFAGDAPESRGGLSFSIVGDDGVRYYGSHLATLDPAVRTGGHVEAGQSIGTVGDTGNAKGTGCHLHFGISTPCGPGDVMRRRGEFRPQEHLNAWRRGEQRSPSPLSDPSSC